MVKRLLTFALSVGFFIWLPSAFADGSGILSLDAPSSIRQTQNNHKDLLTLRVDNIQVRAGWEVTDANGVFTIKAGSNVGVLQTVKTIVAPVIHVATIYAVDRFDLLNPSYANLTASAVITVEFKSGAAEELGLDDAPRLTAVAGEAVSLHTFSAKGGIGTKTYTLMPGDDADYFDLDKNIGVLSLLASAQAGVYTLTVEVADADDNSGTVVAMATVEVSAALMLSDAPLLSVVLGAAVSLHKFTASGGIGIKTYTLAAGDKGYFSVNASSGVLSLLATAQAGVHMVTVQAIDEGDRKVEAVATVRVSAALMLADAPPFTVIASAAMSLHTFIASGGIGTPTYTILASNEKGGFTLNAASGVLSLQTDAAVGSHTLTVQVMDARDNTAQAVATVEVSAALVLAEVPSFTVIASVGMNLHTFVASGGIGTPTYTILAGNEGRDFTLNAASGVLSLSVNAEVGSHTLTVQVMDARNNTAQAVATVEVSAALVLAEVPSFTVIASVGMNLHTFVASGGIGTPTYTILAGNEGRDFTLNAASGVLSLSVNAEVGSHTLTVQVMDARDNTAETVATVGVSAVLALTETPSFTVIASVAMSLHTFVASGGIGSKTYTLLAGDDRYFSVGAGNGVLSLSAGAAVGRHTLTVQVMDARNNTAQAVATVEVSAALALADAPSFTVIASVAMSLHTFAASGGIGSRTYTLVSGNELGYFAVDALSGVLSLLADAREGLYTLTVGVKDERDNTAEVVAVVAVSEVLSLTDAPPLFAVVGVSVSLHTFAATGGVGDKTYTLVAGAEDYFSLGTSSGVLSIQGNASVGIYTLSVQAVSADYITVQAMATVKVLSLFLADAPALYAIVGREVSLYTFAAMGVIGAKTYTIVAGNGNNYFSLDAVRGVLSLHMNAPVGIYTLSVEATDMSSKDRALALVEVRSSLSLSALPLLTVATGESVSLQMLVASGGIGARTYTLVSGNELGYFAVDAVSGALSLLADARDGLYTLTVGVKDERDNTAEGLAVVEVSAALSLAGALSFKVIAGALSLHTFAASGGIGIKTYTLVSGNELGYFSVDAVGGVLSLRAYAAVGVYTLMVQAMDEHDNTAEALATVGVSAVLSLADAPSFKVIVGVAMSLHTFAATEGIGDKTYTLVAGSKDYFSLGTSSGVLSIQGNAPVGIYTLSVEAADVSSKGGVLALVEVRSSLSLSALPLLTVAAGESVSLQMLVASGGIGARTYTLVSANELGYFAVDALNGALSLLADVREGLYTLTVGVKDERGNTAKGLAVVEVSAALSLSDAPSFTVIAGVVLSLHTFAATGGIGDKTYTLVAGSEDYFSLGTSSGVLSIQGNAPVGIYTLSVEAADVSSRDGALALVEVSAVLSLSDAPSFTVIASVALSLHTFAASGGIGIKTYTLVGGQ